MSAYAPPVVSVTMAVCNAESTLRPAVGSILAQSFAEFEFIIVDDGSTDASEDIIRSYDDPRIRLVGNVERKGLAHSLNRAIAVSKGEYLARMDADDVSRPFRFERQLEEFRADPTLGVVGSNVTLVNEMESSVWGLPENSADIRARLAFANAISHPSVMMKREIFAGDRAPYNERFEFAQDYELWTRLAAGAVRFKNIQEPLLDYRVVEAASTKTRSQRDLARQIRIRYLEDLGVAERRIDPAAHHRLSEGRSPETLGQLVRLGRWCRRLPRLLEDTGWDCVESLREEIRWRLRELGRGCETRLLRRATRFARRGL